MIAKSLVSETAKKNLKCKIKSILKKDKYINMQGIVKKKRNSKINYSEPPTSSRSNILKL